MKILGLAIWLLFTAFWAAAGYQIGYLKGKGDLTAWMQTNNVMKIHTVDVCRHPRAAALSPRKDSHSSKRDGLDNGESDAG